jgi:hypothetical protein
MVHYDVPGADGLSLHHFYRAMAWLREGLPKPRQGGATRFKERLSDSAEAADVFDTDP